MPLIHKFFKNLASHEDGCWVVGPPNQGEHMIAFSVPIPE